MVRSTAFIISPAADWSSEVLSSAIKPIAFPPGENEAAELALLKRMGWSRPTGMKAYTAAGTYTDLYVYYDAGARADAPRNEPAERAFKCYGATQNGPRGFAIRGDVAVVKQAPPRTSFLGMMGGSVEPSMDGYDPFLSTEELVETLQYFKDKDCRAVATERDMKRTMGHAFASGAPAGSSAMYYGTGGVGIPTTTSPPAPPAPAGVCVCVRVCLFVYVFARVHALPIDCMFVCASASVSLCLFSAGPSCGACGSTSASMKCGRCKAVCYCNATCQRAHWKAHKTVCHAS